MTDSGWETGAKTGGGKPNGGTVTDNNGDIVALSGWQCLSHSEDVWDAFIGMSVQLAMATATECFVVNVQA